MKLGGWGTLGGASSDEKKQRLMIEASSILCPIFRMDVLKKKRFIGGFRRIKKKQWGRVKKITSRAKETYIRREKS